MKQLEARNLTQSIIFPYKFPYIPSEANWVALQVVDLNGGRSRARTADLLLVRQWLLEVLGSVTH